MRIAGVSGSLSVPGEYRERFQKNVLRVSPEARKSRIDAFISIIEGMKTYERPISDVPTLILTPERDQFLDFSKSRLKQLFPNNEPSTAEGPHGAMINHADSYNEVITKWIKEQFSVSGD